MAKDWGFYGRKSELEAMGKILERGRWFFLKITGRRRIGKSSLVRQVIGSGRGRKVLYIQIPDSDPSGVVSAARDFMKTFGIDSGLPGDLRSLAARLASLVEEGWVVALDEFQYFHRKALFEFTSQLQVEVDRLSEKAERVRGGMIVLGSVHTEMVALLEERTAPLFNRITDEIELGHLDVASLLEMLQVHADLAPRRLLFLWNLFEGVPKFYRDCFERGVLGAEREVLLEQMFFGSSSPLRGEADNWFLRELQGRYDFALKYIAAHPGCSNADVVAHTVAVEPEKKRLIVGYLRALEERFEMIERLQPIFAPPKSRNGRFYIRDNFLRTWLAALSVPAASINFRPVAELVRQANERLAESEGYGLERLAAVLYEERSRKGVGDFGVTKMVRGWWDRAGTEIDLVAVNEQERVIRLGSCKRTPERLVASLKAFDGHVARFRETRRELGDFKLEKVAIAPELTPEQRRKIEEQGYLPQSLSELTAPLKN